jgi:hypothetical protein
VALLNYLACSVMKTVQALIHEVVEHSAKKDTQQVSWSLVGTSLTEDGARWNCEE